MAELSTAGIGLPVRGLVQALQENQEDIERELPHSQALRNFQRRHVDKIIKLVKAAFCTKV